MKIITTRTLLYMSFCTIWGFIFSFVTATTLLAGTTSAQSVSKIEITIEFEGTTIQDAFNEIEEKTELKFLYESIGIEASNKRITIPKTTTTVEKVLIEISAQTGLRFRQTDNTLAVQLNKEPVEEEPLPLPETITGTVIDAEMQEPMPGVNISVKGTTIGTSTDENGTYELNVPSLQDTLIFSFVGYQTQEIPINGNTQIDVAMRVTSLSKEFVVTALGIVRSERAIGYSTQQVDGEDLTYSNENNVIGTLAGKIAGVQVVGASGASMGGTQKIKIRGVNSISGGDEPLIVVDGTPISNANFAGSTGRDYGNISQDINPDDIESINVLKGPAASALYGIRGQYGVIMITTTKGAKGAEAFTVDLNSSFAIERVGNIMPYQNKYGAGSTQDWLTLPNGDPYVQTNYDESWGPKMDGKLVREYFSFYPQDPRYGELTPFDPHPNNVKNYFETGTNFSQGVTISGGSENSRLRISFNNTDIQGVEPNTFLNRNNVGVSAGVDFTERWNVSANVNFATNKARRPTQGAESGSRYFSQWFERQLSMKELKDYKYDDGTFKHWNLTSSLDGNDKAYLTPLYFDNPYFIAYENYGNDSRDRLFGNIGTTFEVNSDLSLSAFIRSDMYTQNLDGRTAFGGENTPAYFTGKYQNTEMNYEVLAQYQKRWNEISIEASLGGNVYDRDYSYVSQSTEGGLSAPNFYNIEASIDRPSVSSYELNKKIVSAFGLVSLGYMDTYFMDVSIRNDKSSALPQDNNSYWYPSVSGSFVFSELLDADALSFGKLRVSYAQAGSDLSPYQTTPFYWVGTNYGSISTLDIPNTLNNPNIKPSFAHSYEAGFDVRFFNRLGLEFTYYLQRNEDQIINLDISGATGYSASTVNAGLIENKGIEIALSGTPVQTQNFIWDASFNFNKNSGKVVELYPGIDVYTYGSTYYSGVRTYLNSYEGDAFGHIVGQAYQRDEATGKILLDDNYLPLYTDNTHDFGSALPDFTGGLQNTLSYKGFNLSASIDFQVGGKFFSRTQSLADRTGLSKKTAAINDKGNNVRDPVAEGGGIKVTGIVASTGQEVTEYVDAKSYYKRLGQRINEPYIYDASYVKLREVRLGYNLGDRFINKLPVQNVNVAFIASNPLMIWQDAPKGLDPSELSTGSQSISWYESGQLNTVRSFGIDINITF